MRFAWPKVIVRVSIVFAACALLGTSGAALIGRILPAPDELAFMAREGENWNIYVLDLQRRIIDQVTAREGDNRYPAWSPDGSRIVFHSDRDSENSRRQYELYVMDPDGRNQQRLTGDNLNAFALRFDGELDFSQGSAMGAWSPDGQSIGFHSDVGGDWNLYALDVASGAVREITRAPNDEVLIVWSPDGERIAYAAGPDERILIYVMDADGENVQKLTGQDLPELSPETTLEPVPPLMATATALVPPAAIVPRNATNTDLIQHWHPDWSADATQIVFASQEDSFIEELYVVNVETGEVTRLTDNTYAEFNPIWLPDGRFVFTSDREVIRNLWIMNADGSGLKRLTPRTYEADGAAWRPQR